MRTKLEEIDLEKFDCRSISESLQNLDSELEKLQNIIYSYPYFYKDNLEYQFRLTFKEDNIILDEVVFDENEDENIEYSVVSEINVFKKSFNRVIELMKKNIDIRDEKTILNNEIINLNDKNIDENKKVVLKELYKIVLESI